MPLFTLICTDKADHLPTRMANREAHVAYLRTSGVVSQAGPFIDAQGAMCGSLIVLDVADRAAAEAWAAADLFAKVRIEAWRKVI